MAWWVWCARAPGGLTTPHKLRIEARSRKRTGRHPVAPGAPQTDGRGRQLHAVVRRQSRASMEHLECLDELLGADEGKGATGCGYGCSIRRDPSQDRSVV